MSKPSTGPGSRRTERYEAQGIDITGPRKNEDNTRDRGHSSDDSKAVRKERAEKTRDAVLAGVHGHDRSRKEIAEEEWRRSHSGVNNGIPLEHRGFNKEDRKRLEAAAKADSEVE